MTDRELLELAAKAAGIGVEWKEVIRSRMAEFKSIQHTKHCGFFADGKEWNPLAADGAALRLAVKLGIEPRFIDNSHSNGVELSRVTLHNISGIVEKVGDDSYAATRRAIVRAAAEIGRHLK